ncbi:rhodanese-related sulfurtransferase [Pontibacter aydingkolensis]|uniref:Rhodanese-like domain-containing protein n=1 Tax=Pontibacter aydingkolensis TaxID=1911536 RepID=A0ABS7CW83_9BACT|nr:rhodanese-like domain-containing protein [Pontibacter aydingkolensis]MBW7468045.1 rhodanese-like domain-containing protein [Pontibacter aydingkolensis]
MIRKTAILLAFKFILVFNTFGQIKNSAYHTVLKGLYNNTVPVITPARLHQKLGSQNNVVLLDTRSKSEYEVSHLKGALLVDYDSFVMEQVRHLPKTTLLVVYCSVGYRSEKIGEKLKKEGYTNVYNLYGGIFEWVNNGFAVYNAKGSTQRVHAYSTAWGIWLTKGEKVYE